MLDDIWGIQSNLDKSRALHSVRRDMKREKNHLNSGYKHSSWGRGGEGRGGCKFQKMGGVKGCLHSLMAVGM